MRLLTITPPSGTSPPMATPDCGADDAWHALQGILPVGAEVIVNGLEGEPATDRYDRTLANVYARHVSLWLVEQGWAVTSRTTRPPKPMTPGPCRPRRSRRAGACGQLARRPSGPMTRVVMTGC